jgi:hypothetical protein
LVYLRALRTTTAAHLRGLAQNDRVQKLHITTKHAKDTKFGEKFVNVISFLRDLRALRGENLTSRLAAARPRQVLRG